eukprot:SAG22_NODE_3339_length_1770_cov_0.929982_3_plen_183_part_01
MHLDKTMVALQRLVLAAAVGRGAALGDAPEVWGPIAERAAAALAVGIVDASEAAADAGRPASPNAAGVLIAGHTELLFRFAMVPTLQLQLIQAGGYEALCAHAPDSLLATAAVAALTELYQEKNGPEAEQLALQPALVGRLCVCLAGALAAGQLEVALEGGGGAGMTRLSLDRNDIGPEGAAA